MEYSETTKKIARAMSIIEIAIADAAEQGCSPLMIGSALYSHAKDQAALEIGEKGMHQWIRTMAEMP